MWVNFKLMTAVSVGQFKIVVDMLMATGGRERSQEAFERLLTEAGFCFVDVRRVAALPAVLCAEAI